MNNVFLLIFEYFKIGCVAIGGGYTTIPFLYYLVEKYGWFDVSEITQMIAVSNLTPGPIGINMATYAGLKVGVPIGFCYGVLTSFLVSIAFLLPSFVIVLFLAKFLSCNKENKYVQSVLYGLRPAAIALLCVSALKILNVAVLRISDFSKIQRFQDIISIKAFVLLVVFLLIGLKLKKKPMYLILIAIIIGSVLRV